MFVAILRGFWIAHRKPTLTSFLVCVHTSRAAIPSDLYAPPEADAAATATAAARRAGSGGERGQHCIAGTDPAAAAATGPAGV